MLLRTGLLLFFCGSAGAESLYSYVDENGFKVFTNIGTVQSRASVQPAVSSSRPGAAGGFLPLIRESAALWGLDPNLVQAVVAVESSFNPNALSSKGCMGLMQLHPDTARRFGVRNAFDAAENLQGGTRYLNFLMDSFDGHLPHVLAAYNAGENAVVRHQGIPPYPETRNYVRKVLAAYEALSAKDPAGPESLRRVVLPGGGVLLTNMETDTAPVSAPR